VDIFHRGNLFDRCQAGIAAAVRAIESRHFIVCGGALR
jgi:hypothetical protein